MERQKLTQILIFPLLLVSMLMGCSGKSSESVASFDVSLGGLSGIAQYSSGGAMLIGNSPTTGHAFAKRLDSIGGDVLTMDLPNGKWDFSVLMWDGDHDRDGDLTDGVIALTGKVRCALSVGHDLYGSEVTIGLTANNSNCALPYFGNSTIDDGTGTGTFKFTEITFRQCRIPLSEVATENATECVEDKKGLLSSMQLILSPFQDGPELGFSVGVTDALIGPCVDATVGSSAELADYSQIDGSSAIPNFPFGNLGGLEKLIVVTRGHLDGGCSGARGSFDIEFRRGLANSAPLAKSFETNSVVVLETPDSLVCEGFAGDLRIDFSAVIANPNPIYGICNADQFQLIVNDFTSGPLYQNAHFILLSDINFFEGQIISPTSPPVVANFPMIGEDFSSNKTSSAAYTGTFYGNNRRITGMTLDLESESGEISEIGFIRNLSGRVKDLSFIFPEISTNEREYHHKVGVVAGTVTGAGGEVDNITIIHGNVEGREEVGLFAGHSDGSGHTFKFLKSRNGEVEGQRNVGGIAGYVNDVTLEQVDFNGSVTIDGSGNQDGFCENSSFHDQASCVGAAAVWNSFEGFGGLIGNVETNIQIFRSTSKGLIIGGTGNGGLIGISQANGTVEDSYSVMTVLGTKNRYGTDEGDTGGLIGKVDGAGFNLTRVYYTMGTLFNFFSNTSFVNSIVGNESVATTKINVVAPAALTSTSAEYSSIRSQSTMQASNFTEVNGWRYDDPDLDLPILSWEEERPCHDKLSGSFAGGSGSASDPYQICSATQFSQIETRMSSHFKLMRPIDLSIISETATTNASALVPSDGSGAAFTGKFDGDGFILNNLATTATGSSTNPVGLFSRIGLGGEVSNLIAFANVTTPAPTMAEPMGAISGENEGLIDRVFLFGQVKSFSTEVNKGIGGIVGVNRGEIVSGEVFAQVKGHHSVGGIAGINEGGLILFTRSHSVVAPTYNDRLNRKLGGLVGSNITGTGGSFIDDVYGENFSYNGHILESSFFGELTSTYGPSAAEKGVYYQAGLLAGYSEGTIRDCEVHGVLNFDLASVPTYAGNSFDASAPSAIAADELHIISVPSIASIDSSQVENWTVDDLIFKFASGPSSIRIPGPHGIDTALLTAGSTTITPFIHVGQAVGEMSASGILENTFISSNISHTASQYYSEYFGNVIGRSHASTPIMKSYLTGNFNLPGSNDLFLANPSDGNVMGYRNSSGMIRLIESPETAQFTAGPDKITPDSAVDLSLFTENEISLGTFPTNVTTNNSSDFDIALSGLMPLGISLPLYVQGTLDFNDTNFPDFFENNLNWNIGMDPNQSIWTTSSDGGGYSARLIRGHYYSEYHKIQKHIETLNSNVSFIPPTEFTDFSLSLATPTQIVSGGGQVVTLSGENLGTIESVNIAGFDCGGVTVVDENTITCTTTGTMPVGLSYISMMSIYGDIIPFIDAIEVIP